MWLNLKSEFSFGKVYGHLDQIAKQVSEYSQFAGLCDLNNTFGHVRWKKSCEKVGLKPIYGVCLPVVNTLEHNKDRRYPFNYMTFIAKTNKGLQEIYGLVDISHKQFYYRQRLTYEQVNNTSPDIIVLSGVSPRWDLVKRTVFQELGPHIPFVNQNLDNGPTIATIDNYYPRNVDRWIYEPFADHRQLERKTTLSYIPTPEEWLTLFPGRVDALKNGCKIGEICNATLTKAPMVKYIGKEEIEKWCKKGAKEKGINIIGSGVYKDRYEREIKIVKEKKYVDYFLMVADLIKFAKKKMVVGPGRGSSAGSLVCYLMGITEVDPIKYDLLFERFIDLNRYDLPDIDIDFQDDKRDVVLKYLQKKYGPDNVAQLGNISRLKPKSALIRFSKALCIPENDIHEFKDSIPERPEGDKRANFCIKDAINTTELGKSFIEKYPNMAGVVNIEGHASHTSVHAAGVLVCNEPITHFCGVNSREKGKSIAMIDKRDAEQINLLKLDSLGLRTLTILAGVCDQLGKKYSWLYEIPLDDPVVFKVFNDNRFSGIFQFEGQALKGISKKVSIKNIEDITALTSLCRPGALSSGGATRYIQVKNGEKELEYLSNHEKVVAATKNTFGMIVYQEQMLSIAREYAGFSWLDCGKLRKGVGKSMGDEFFNNFKEKFIQGALKTGDSQETAEKVWDGIKAMGGYAFNKSHAVCYSVISYLCAYMKAYYPLEFVVSSLNNTKNDNSAIKILRDAVETEGVVYEYLNPDLSEKRWVVKEGILYGGLLSIDGIGPAKANQIIKARKEKGSLTQGLQEKLFFGYSPFKYLYPGKELYGDFYSDPSSHGVQGQISTIAAVKNMRHGTCTFIGRLLNTKIKDSNDSQSVANRGGEFAIGATTSMNIVLEDDTEEFLCKIPVDIYQKMGDFFSKSAKIDKDWFMVYGQKTEHIVIIKNIMKITRED